MDKTNIYLFSCCLIQLISYLWRFCRMIEQSNCKLYRPITCKWSMANASLTTIALRFMSPMEQDAPIWFRFLKAITKIKGGSNESLTHVLLVGSQGAITRFNPTGESMPVLLGNLQTDRLSMCWPISVMNGAMPHLRFHLMKLPKCVKRWKQEKL